MSLVYVPLFGPNDHGHPPKGVNASGWQLPGYLGVAPDDWTGLRLDNYIVVDCDCEEAYEEWLKRIDKAPDHTWTRKTPHGYHLFYRRPLDVYHVQAQKLNAKTDLKLGMGHQVVFNAPGYYDLHDVVAIPFDASWVPERQAQEWLGEEWSEMPEGIGDNSMMSFAGTFRRWGMDERTILACLSAINEIVMTKDPMPRKALRRLARQAAKFTPADAKVTICPKCETEIETR